MASGRNHNGLLTNGTLYIGGDFHQIGTETTTLYGNGYYANFYTSENHKTVLNGPGRQTVIFDSTSSHFGALELTKSIDRYSFNRTPCWLTLITSDVTENTFILPQMLQIIDAEAFMGDKELQVVTIPEESLLTEIQTGAFKNCTNLIEINLPETITYIAPDAFDGCPHLTLIVSNQYAEQYAIDNGIAYENAA